MLRDIGWAMLGVSIIFTIIVCFRWRKHFRVSLEEEQKMYHGNWACTIIAFASSLACYVLITLANRPVSPP
ncbi:MAG: hypothetical protein WEC84_03525 [Candidatus Andersenbacteria bacterium]